MPVLLNYPLFHADDDNGAPLTGGLLYSYIAGTSTAKATYTTRAMSTANANPVVLNSRGEAVIYGSGLYKLVLKTSASVTIWTQDNVELGPGQGSYSYFVDPSETDQGTTGSGASLYDILVALGSSTKATVYFPHSGTAATTTYTVSTTFDASAYTNVSFAFENGAVLSVATGITLTLPSPASIMAQPNQQIFSGSGTVAFSTKGRTPVQWWPATIAGYHAAIEASAGGGVAYFPAGTYTMDSIVGIDTTSDIVIEGDGKYITILDATSSDTLFKGTANLKVRNVNFHDWSIVLDYGSTGGAVNETVDWIEFENCLFTKIDSTAIKWGSPAASAKLEKLVVRNCVFSGQGSRNTGNGISVACDMDETFIEGNSFTNMDGRPVVLGGNVYAQQDTMQRYFVRGNKIEDIDTGANSANGILCYGREVVITDNILDTITKTDRTTDCEGIYTKARYFVISNNILHNAGGREGFIAVKGSDRAMTTTPQGHTGIVSNNILYASLANSVGILINDSDVECAGNVLEGFTFCGININSGAMDNINCHHNIIRNTHGAYGIYNESDGDNVYITDNIIDTIDNSEGMVSDVAGIWSTVSATETINRLYIDRNIIENLSGGSAAEYGIYISPDATATALNYLSISGNRINGAGYSVRIRSFAPDYLRMQDNDFDGYGTGAVLFSVVPTNATYRNNRGLDSFQTSVADDAATSFTPPSRTGIVTVIADNLSAFSGVVLYQAEAGGAATVSVGAGASLAVATGALAGTTGTDAKITVSAHTDGKIYIENRSGVNPILIRYWTSGGI